MKKLGNLSALLLMLIPMISFAQRSSRGRVEDGDIKENIAIVPGHTPINQYEIALIIMAVSIIAYFVYRQYAKRQA